VPLLLVAGGAALVWIAIKLTQKDGDHSVRQGTTLFEAIWIIVLADFIMSLDNVLAVTAAAHGNMLLVLFSIGL